MRETWLVRHAQSTANAGMPTEAPASTALSELGRKQARLLAQSVKQAPDLIVTSPYLRTLQTAQPLMDIFPGCAHEQWPVQEFTYLNPDRYRGTTNAGRAPMVNAYWKELDPESQDGPGAESFASFMDRVRAFLERAGMRDGLAIVFTHGQFMRGCLWRLFVGAGCGDMDGNAAMSHFRNWRSAFRMANTAVVRIRWEEDGPLFSGMRLTHLTAADCSF